GPTTIHAPARTFAARSARGPIASWSGAQSWTNAQYTNPKTTPRTAISTVSCSVSPRRGAGRSVGRTAGPGAPPPDTPGDTPADPAGGWSVGTAAALRVACCGVVRGSAMRVPSVGPPGRGVHDGAPPPGLRARPGAGARARARRGR